MSEARILRLPVHANDRGRLVVAETDAIVPFEIRRVFWIDQVPEDITRGGHAHARCGQVLVCVCGMVTVQAGNQSWLLWLPQQVLYVPPFVRVEMRDFRPGTVLLVLCSEHYDESDYVYD